MIKKFILLLIVTLPLVTFAQKQFSKEFSFHSDNDLYISIKKDRYYTNGMFLSYRYLSSFPKQNMTKKIYELQIGQEMYTPHKATVDSKEEHDRPFAAHLFASFGINRFYKNNSSLKTTIILGTIGPNAFGQELQDFIHEQYGYKKAIGWNYQIANALSFNFNTTYLNHIAFNNSKTLDLTWTNQLRIGTTYTDLNTGLYARIGFKPLLSLFNTIAFQSNLNNTHHKTTNTPELFLFINPKLHYIIYDATIQGSFLNDNNPITYNVIPIKLTTQIGLQFTMNRCNFGYFINYHSKKVKNTKVANTNFYGTFVLNYQFN